MIQTTDQALQFLSLVWGTRLGWVDIPSKAAGHWVPFSASWPEDKPLIARRIESCLEDEEDIYFSVSQFSEDGRRIADTLSSHWLWADLDVVGPDDCAELDLTPTVCWESSPFRYQALWKLDKKLSPQVLARVNKALSYTLGADKGGWDLTQVLRPVGTRNQKYPGSPEVMLVYDDGPEYSARELWHSVRGAVSSERPRAARQSISRERGLARIPARARALLATPPDRVVRGERSSKLWELNCLLAEAGLATDEILDLVAECAWNKFGHRTNLLEKDIARAIAHVSNRQPVAAPATGNGHRRDAAKTLVEKVTRVEEAELEELDLSEPSDEVLAEEEERRVHLPFVGYSRFMATNLEAPRWLIQDLWMTQSHGVIGGDPKSSKSLVSLAMGLSIASGRPFLGDDRFQVSTPGPVLMIQEENTPWDVQDKLRKLAMLYGLIDSEDVEVMPAGEGSVAGEVVRLGFPTEAPLLLLNNFGFDLSEEEMREALEESIRDVGPVMVILDPLYLMLGSADADRADQVRPFQKWLLSLRYTYGTAVVVVHHFGKPRVDEGRKAGHRLLGSGTWYNWVDSAVYCDSVDPEGQEDIGGDRPNRCLKVAREWRGSAPQAALDVRMRMGDPGDLRLSVAVGKYDLLGLATRVVGEDPGITLLQLAEEIGRSKQATRRLVVGAGFRMEGGKRGRGHSWRVYPAGDDERGEAAGQDDGETEG